MYTCKHCDKEHSQQTLAVNCCPVKGTVDELLNDDFYVAKKFINKSMSSKRRGIDFELTFAQYKSLLKRKKCYYTGVDLIKDYPANTHPDEMFTLDRIDSNIGYTKENTVPCCYIVNTVKGHLESAKLPTGSFKLALTGIKSFIDKMVGEDV